MHISIRKELLVQTLAHANRIIEKRQASPVFGCVLFQVGQDYIKITATNMDMTVIDTIEFDPADCVMNESGEYCLPVGLLYDIAKKFNNNSNIILRSDDDTNAVQISNNKTEFIIHYIDSNSFPPLELVNDTGDYVQFSIRAEVLKNALDIAKVSMSRDVIRTQLNGIYIHYNNDDNTMRFVSTDLFRVSCVSISAPENAGNIKPIIISKKTVGELLHMLADIDKQNDVTLKVNEKQIIMEAIINEKIKATYISRVVNGNFPEYRTALEVDTDKVLVVNVKDLISAIDRVDTIVSDLSNSIQLSICKNMLTVSGISKEFGSAIEVLECNYHYKHDETDNNVTNSTEEFKICFNSKYLLELVKQINTKEVYMYFNTNVSPTIIKPDPHKIQNDLSLVSVIMPVEIVHN